MPNTFVHPSVLFITPAAFNSLTGGGITFTNLFRGWPKDRIATVTSDHVPPSHEICDQYYFLSRREFSWKFPFSLANIFGGGQEEVAAKVKQGSHRGLNTLKRLSQAIFGEELPADAVLSDALRDWIRKFQPQVIYTILGNLPYIRLVRRIADEFKIPLVIHMMDDWPKALYQKGVFHRSQKTAMQHELQELISESALCLGISESMCQAFSKRYGKPFRAFHNAISAQEWLPKSKKDWKAGNPFRVVYVGALMKNSQMQSVKDVCKAVEQLRHEGADIVFEIVSPWFFANQYRAELERFDGVQVLDAPDSMDAAKLFTGADLLLLPVNFDDESIRYIRYSMPTKIPAYMFSGTPTLAYGPVGVASIQYAQKWAHAVLERDAEQLKIALQKLMNDENLRKELGQRAIALAQKNHDAEKVSSNFQSALTFLK